MTPVILNTCKSISRPNSIKQSRSGNKGNLSFVRAQKSLTQKFIYPPQPPVHHKQPTNGLQKRCGFPLYDSLARKRQSFLGSGTELKKSPSFLSPVHVCFSTLKVLDRRDAPPATWARTWLNRLIGVICFIGFVSFATLLLFVDSLVQTRSGDQKMWLWQVWGAAGLVAPSVSVFRIIFLKRGVLIYVLMYVLMSINLCHHHLLRLGQALINERENQV